MKYYLFSIWFEGYKEPRFMEAYTIDDFMKIENYLQNKRNVNLYDWIDKDITAENTMLNDAQREDR